MALSATINKLTLHVADMDRQYYQTHELTVAQHPSETASRFIVRVIAFALNAHEDLQFTKGLCVDGEPELWRKSLSDDVELWIDFGQLDEKRIRKASSRAEKLIIYTYHKRKAQVWWQQNQTKFDRFKNLSIFHINAEDAEALVQRNMQLQCSIDSGDMVLSDADNSINIKIENIK